MPMLTQPFATAGWFALALSLSACDSATTPVAGPSARVARESRVFVQRERLGNPLVAEVLLRKARHQAFNTGTPVTDPAEFSLDITAFVTEVAGRDPSVAATLNAVLLPDMLLAFPQRNPATAGWLSWALAGGYGGRRLSDDVVDAGLMALFGALLNPNNTSPGLSTDNVGANDRAFLGVFPYLAAAH